jgi:sugar phosphate isomerase/epimerase
MLPFCGKVDFAAVTKALGEIGFDGLIDFEVERPLRSFPPELHGSFMHLALDVGRYLERQILAHRKDSF